MSKTRVISAVLLLFAHTIGVFSQAVPPPGPTQPGTAQNCNKWHTVKSGDGCAALESRYQISHAQFLAWNPAVSEDCLQNFWPDYAYCVSVDPTITSTLSTSSFTTITTRTTSATTTSVPPPVSTPYTIDHPITDQNITTPTIPSEPWPPQKTQAGQPSYCNDWHLVRPGESCESIVSEHNTWMGLEDFLLWNPALGSDCKGIYLFYYVCVGIQRQTQISIDFPTFIPNATIPPMVIPTPVELPPVDNNFEPVPVQGPLPTDCQEYYQARSGETCRDIVAAHKSITQSQFLAWHPFLNNNCDGLWAGYYYCLWAGSSTPEPPVQTTVPEPVEPDTTSDCRAWFKGDGFTCDDIVYIFGRFSLSDFIKWNPRLGASCGNMRPEYWYCVAVPGTPTTRTAPLPSATDPPPDSTTSAPATTTSSGPVVTPTPIQSGMISGCRKFYLVQAGDGCWAIANSAGIALERHACYVNSTPVPLDYQKPQLGRASIPLKKYPALEHSPDGPYQGMVLLNPGGPGGSGIESIESYGDEFLPGMIGSNWDFVGFDPRGMHASEPKINCSANTRATDDYHETFMRFAADLGSDCAAQSGGELDAGPYMSTAINARDMLSIVDAFAATEDGQRAARPSHLLNFFGVSYGTMLGQTFASMFPERVGNMVLDAVVDPEDYLTSMTRKNLNHLDSIIDIFFIYCQEAGLRCSYYTPSSAKDISDRFHRSLARLDAEKAREENWSNATEIESALILLKSALLWTAYEPSGSFDVLASVLFRLESAIRRHTLSSWIQYAMEQFGDPYPSGMGEAAPFMYGVLCSDQNNRWYNKTLEDFKPLLVEAERQSIAADVWFRNVLICSGWSIKAAETFTGPFTGNTATPILFVGNTYDPATPFENAVSSAQNYKDAQTLIVDALGHDMVHSNNLCAYTKVGKYFRTGELPGNDSFCPFNGTPFMGILSVNGTLEETIVQAGLSSILR